MNLSVMKNRNYILVVLGRFVSQFGTYLQSFALSLYVLEKTGSAALFSTVIVISIIPRLILMPFAGVIADRFSRKKMVVGMDIISGIFVMGISALFVMKQDLSLAMIYLIVIVLNSISVFFMPAISSIMPDIVEKEKLADANSLMEFSGAIIMLIVPIVAGFIYSAFGLLPILIVNGISFLASAFSESFIRIKKESIISKEDKEKFFSSFKKGLEYIKKMPEFIILIGSAFTANFALGPIFSIALPIVVLKDFGLSNSVYGIVTSLMTVGMFLGPVFAAKIINKTHYSKIATRILTFSGILCLLIAGASIKGVFPNVYFNLVVMVVLINILMIAIIWVNLAITTARQRIVPGHLQGRVSSVIGMFAMLATPAGQGLMGSLLDVSKSYIIIGIYALLVVLSGIFAGTGYAYLRRKGKMYIEPSGNETIIDSAETVKTV